MPAFCVQEDDEYELLMKVDETTTDPEDEELTTTRARGTVSLICMQVRY